MDVRMLATVNLVVQALLLVTVIVAIVLAKKRQLVRHCNVVRAAIGLQILLIAVIMTPAMLGYIASAAPFNLEVFIHHSLGVIVVLMWIYFNLVVTGVVKMRHRLVWPMRTAFLLWVIAFFLGLRLYLMIY
ncbi:MAG: hypothetical protein HY670_06275 [Chloroflexi bacterium]|nr:hypothetical protein [Chloroflexota bacterium]